MTETTTNRVIVIGTLDTIRERRKDVTVADTRTRTGGLLDRFVLQVASPYGEAFALPLTASACTTGMELLAQAKQGEVLVVEGIARMYQDIDRRYVIADDDRGRSYRELRVQVTTIRARTEDEPLFGSFAWLEGTVAEPPRLVRHPNVPGLELAATLLNVVVAEPSSYPGSRLVTRSAYQVPVMVPLATSNAGLLYKQGNLVRVEGQFDRTIVPQRGAAVDARLAQLEKTFNAETAHLEGQARNDAERRYRRERRNLMEAARASVLVGFVEALDAEAIDWAAAQQERAAYTAHQREARERRAQTRLGEDVHTHSGTTAGEGTGNPQPDVLRPRRRVRDEALATVQNGSEDE